MPLQCRLILDNYVGHYVPGAPIQGRVVLSLDSDITLRGVRVALSCIERTAWMGTESYYDSEAREQKSRDTEFRGESEVFSTKDCLYGDQRTNTNLPSGQHIYPFLLTLQQNIPGSFECDKGAVVYLLTATVDRPMAFDYQDQMQLVVKSPVDLRFIARPDDLNPMHLSDEKSVCCWCCAQGPISMDLEVPKRTLIPGEVVELKMHLTNMANTNVEGVALQLQQIMSYKVNEPSRDDRQDCRTLVDLSDVGLGAHGENTYVFRVGLPPNAVLPNFVQCRLFSVEYMYKAVAKLSSMHKNLEIRVAPKVGHIPLGGPAYLNPPADGLYPAIGPTPSAPLLDAKEREAAGWNGQGAYDQAPPSYESLNAP